MVNGSSIDFKYMSDDEQRYASDSAHNQNKAPLDHSNPLYNRVVCACRRRLLFFCSVILLADISNAPIFIVELLYLEYMLRHLFVNAWNGYFGLDQN